MISVSATNITKTYKLYDKPIDRVKETFNPFKKLYHKPFNALNKVSFNVNCGETFGIVGRNGSGKSTLLQVISGILQPTSGEICVNGRIAAILELGAGFNPEFTGEQNIHINASILGLNKEEIDEKYNEIVEFADIGEFIKQPIKTYSSGMIMRLAFSISVSVDPDIFIIDEALAVGDAIFITKCFKKLHSLQKRGITILFVSHDKSAIISLCDRAMLLESGEIHLIDKAEKVINRYDSIIRIKQESSNYYEFNKNTINKLKKVTSNELKYFKKNFTLEKRWSANRYGIGCIRIINFYISGRNVEQPGHFWQGDKLILRIYCEAFSDVKDICIGYFIKTDKGLNLTGTNTLIEKYKLPDVKKKSKLIMCFETDLNIKVGTYSISFGISGIINQYQEEKILDWIDLAYAFNVNCKSDQYDGEQHVLLPHKLKFNLINFEETN